MASEDEIEVTQVNKHDLIDLTTDAEVVEKSFVSDKTLPDIIRACARTMLSDNPRSTSKESKRTFFARPLPVNIELSACALWNFVFTA